MPVPTAPPPTTRARVWVFIGATPGQFAALWRKPARGGREGRHRKVRMRPAGAGRLFGSPGRGALPPGFASPRDIWKARGGRSGGAFSGGDSALVADPQVGRRIRPANPGSGPAERRAEGACGRLPRNPVRSAASVRLTPQGSCIPSPDGLTGFGVRRAYLEAGQIRVPSGAAAHPGAAAPGPARAGFSSGAR